MPADLQRARQLFLYAVGQLPAEQWDAYVIGECGPDGELQAHVLHLLAVHREAGSFLERPVAGVAATSAFTPSPEDTAVARAEAVGAAIGPYRLLEEIGAGGMGTVWMAEQTEPVKRLVAVKLVKPGMDSKQVVARFEAERQALALMDHPNIARVLDGGATAAGRPFFVMELVRGMPITRYCDENRLTVRQRLELFVPVCRAVQHAHQKGIIHRDLKPSNVLVGVYDDQPVPKVIDFGIAKATGEHLTEHTVVTGFGAVVGTLEYMSPEQAELGQLDVDTRSDVYSLGVMLYELLTGTTPLDRARLRKGSLLEVLRIIREEEPPRPSTRLSTAAGLPGIAASRGLEPKKLSGMMRGELDWIVMKALDKDRGRRYDSANGLAQDVERYLADQPVLACPPSATYHLRKFARRNRTTLAVAGLVLFFLAALGGVAAWAAKDRADREHEAQLQETARRAALEADVSRDLDEARTFCRQGRLREASAVVAHAEVLAARAEAAGEIGVRVALVRADVDMAVRLDTIRLERIAASKEPIGFLDFTRADVRYRDAFRDYGVDVTALDADAAAARVEASAIKSQLLAALDDWLCAKAGGSLADRDRLLAVLRRIDPDPWRARLRDASVRHDRAALKNLARDPQAAALPPATAVLLSAGLAYSGEHLLVAEVLRSVQQRHPDDFWVNYTLGYELAESDPAQAGVSVRYYQAALALRPDSPEVHGNLGYALFRQGDLTGAVAALQKALAIRPDLMWPRRTLATVFRDLGDLPRAVAEARKAVADHPSSDQAHQTLGCVLQAQGDLAGSVAEHRTAIALAPGFPDHHANLGSSLFDLGDWVGAVAESRQALLLDRSNTVARRTLGMVCLVQGDLAGAAVEFGRAVAWEPSTASHHAVLATVLAKQGDWAGAAREGQQAIALQSDSVPAHVALGDALIGQGFFRQALDENRRAHELFSRRNPAVARLMAQRIRDCERLLELEGKLPAFLQGKTRVADPAEQLELARLCSYKRLHRTAARFYEEALAARPELANDPGLLNRYAAAQAAAQAGCGQGVDAGQLDDAERTRLRRQALRWLRADLQAWGDRLDQGPDPAGLAVATIQLWQKWLTTNAFAGVRGPALARLPQAERQEWQALWDDVATTRERARKKLPPEKQVGVIWGGPRVQPGQELELAGPTLAGDKFDLKQLRGKVVLIYFWASWYGWTGGLENVRPVYDRYHKDGFEVVGISLDYSRQDLAKFLHQVQIPGPQIFFPDKGLQGPNNPLARRYGVGVVPSTILVDRAGKVVQVDLWGETLGAAVAKLLGKPTDPPAPAVQNEKAQGAFRVRAVSLRAEPDNYSGPAPARIHFRGKITANGPGTVRYVFVRSDNSQGPTMTLTFERAGVQEVSTEWHRPGRGEGWQMLKVLAPNPIDSEKAHFKFECTQ